MRRARLGYFTSALAGLIVGAVLVVAIPALGSAGDDMVVGEYNRSGGKVTRLKGTASPTLRLINKNHNPGLEIRVNADTPPIKVNSSTRVNNLNADRVDGKHASQLAVPSGAVMFFDLTSCPGGWTEYTPARGRTIVGLNVGGNLHWTKGTALSNLQWPTAAAHQHAWSIYYTTGKSWKTWAGDGNLKLLVDYGSPPRNDGTTITYALAPHSTHVGSDQVYYTAQPDNPITVNMPYVQLLGCKKN
jgi:hypothetical protein